MSTLLLINKSLITEAPVSGDKTAQTLVKGGEHLAKAKKRLGDLGIHDLPSLNGVTTIDQLSIEPFKFTFAIQVKDDIEALTLPKPIRVNSLARVIESKPLTLECKNMDNNELFTLVFTVDSELTTRLPGTKKDIKALVSESNDRDGKFYTVSIDDLQSIIGEEGGNKKEGNGKKSEDVDKEDEGGDKGGDDKPKDKKPNYYNGKDLKEVNQKLSELKDKANFFKIISSYKDNSEFQDIFLDAIINSTKSIKINQKPLHTTLKDLKNSGVLEADQEFSTSKRKFLKIKLNLQNFMVDVFSLFAKVAKNGRQSRTFEVIKKFYKELFLITSKGKTSISDKQTRTILWKKLMGSFSNFLSSIRKLPEMTKGSIGKDEKKGKEINVKNTPKTTNITTVESIIDTISKSLLIIEQDEKVETTGKIYIEKIVLGPKAEAKRDGDVNNYNKSVRGGSTKWSGLVRDLPKPKSTDDFQQMVVNFELVDKDKLDDNQKNVFDKITRKLNFSDRKQYDVGVRRSMTEDNTIVIRFEPTKVIVCEVKPGDDLQRNMKSNIVLVAPYAAGEDVRDSTEAYLQILTK